MFFSNYTYALIAVLTLHSKKFLKNIFLNKFIFNGQTSWSDHFKINTIQKLLTFQLLSHVQ